MAVTVPILFDQPQLEIASLLRDRLSRCVSASLIAGFMTVEGIEALAGCIRVNADKLTCLVVGASTYRTYKALDKLLAAGVQLGRLHLHLGWSRPAGGAARHAHQSLTTKAGAAPCGLTSCWPALPPVGYRKMEVAE
jgi:hypothetical protein